MSLHGEEVCRALLIYSIVHIGLTFTGLFFASSAVGGLVSGIIAWATAKNLEGDHGLHSWQWLFIATGVPTIGLGIVVCFLLPGLPDQVAKKPHLVFRNSEERDLILQRLHESKRILSEPLRYLLTCTSL
jgi:MFS family permease